MEKCRKCNRKFAKDRLDKHYAVCKGTLEVEPPKQKNETKDEAKEVDRSKELPAAE